ARLLHGLPGDAHPPPPTHPRGTLRGSVRADGGDVALRRAAGPRRSRRRPEPARAGRPRLSPLRRVLLWVMGIFYAASGVVHVVDPGFYLPMMPPYLPWHLGLVYLSGVAEIVLGVAVLVPATRRVAAWGVILLLVAVFPPNLPIPLHAVPPGRPAHGFRVRDWLRR